MLDLLALATLVTLLVVISKILQFKNLKILKNNK